MQLTEIVHGTKEYVRVAVCATKAGVNYDPTGDNVAFAVCAAEDAEHPPDLTTWYTGQWETVSGVHYALLLVNETNGWAPLHGDYALFVKVSDNPETPIKLAGLVKVF